MAQEPPAGEGSSTWGLGIGVGSKQKPYKGIGRDNEVLPLIEYENAYVHVLGPMLEVKIPSIALGDTQKLNLGLVARYAIFGGYEADDAPILNGMAERKDGVWAGAKAEWENSLGTVYGEWLFDMSRYSKGQKASLGLERTWHFGHSFMLTPRVTATWQDGKYNNYYFGVADSEATPGRQAYEAGSGVNAEIGLRAIYMIDRHHSFLMDAWGATQSSAVKDSPLVDRRAESRFVFAYVYRF
ncbi:MipA/OmpV family protein [Niveibacterium sp. SC-1]|uniref:MipA/OmpV family protein n=1 Tax=Niveibacterium sp. SC-1 TaxID=3135646 RepID=UPI00311FF8EE